MTIEWLSYVDWSTPPLYLSIANAIAAALEKGRLSEGDVLPPHRDCASQLGVAIGTITRAYAEAERMGLCVASGRNGTRIRAGARKAGTSLEGFGRHVPGLVDLGVNYPFPGDDPDPAKALSLIAKRFDRRELLRYAPPDGLPRHRKAFSAFLEACGVDAEPERLVLCHGAQHGISVLFSGLLKPGDQVAVEAMTYPGAKTAAEQRGLVLNPVPVDGQGMSAKALDALCGRKTLRAVYCIPSIQNPSGISMSAERKDEIARVARKRDLIVIEDEIHRPLACPLAPSSEEEAALPFIALAPERSYLITSVSKAVCGGLRLGAIAAPPGRAARVSDAVLSSLWACSALPFELFAAWLEDGTVARTVARRRASNAARQGIAASSFGAYWKGPPAGGEAGPFLWLPMPRGMGRERFVSEALKQGIVVSASDAFMAGNGRPPEAVRISLSGAETDEQLERALARLAAILAGEKGAGSEPVARPIM